jgi:hypothetical protein
MGGVWRPDAAPGVRIGLVVEPFAKDEKGRTPLHHAAARGVESEVWAVLSKVRGTGIFPPRQGLIEIKDAEGLTAADLAERSGHAKIAELLRGEVSRMEFFE